MPFGDTAKKIQRVADIAEKLYERLNQVIEQVQEVRERVERTSDQIETMDRELAEQRAIVEALAEQQGVDPDAVVAERVPDPDEETADESGTEESADDVADEDAATGDQADDGDAAGTGASTDD